MDFILQQERIAHDSYDVYNHLEPHQERALYQCFYAELELSTNVISGDFNSGKRLVLSWLVRLCGGATLIAVASKIEMMKWKHHFEHCPHRIDYLKLWRKKECAKRAAAGSVWYHRFIVDVSAKPATRYGWTYDYCWKIERRPGGIVLASPFSFSLFRVFRQDNVSLKDWKCQARSETSLVRLYSLLAFVVDDGESPIGGDAECPICRESQQSTLVTPCGHSFCAGCIFSSFLYGDNFTCPMCRSVLEGGRLRWRGSKRLPEAVLSDFESFSEKDEYGVVYDPRNRFAHIPVARLTSSAQRPKLCRIVRMPRYSSVPLPHITHFFSAAPAKQHIWSALFRKYFSSFERKNILKIFYFDN